MSTHAIIQTLTDKIKAECQIVDREAAFDEALDADGPVRVAGMILDVSRIMKEMDPIAYRCGVNDYADGEPWVEIDGETYQQDEVEAVIQEFKDGLESELSDLESELENLKNDQENLKADDDSFEDIQEKAREVTELESQISEKQAEIAAIEADPFFS